MNGFLMNLRSTLEGMAKGESPFLLSVYTNALTKQMEGPTFEQTLEKFAAILNDEEQESAENLGSILENIDKYFEK
jgi:hypothetical protein